MFLLSNETFGRIAPTASRSRPTENGPPFPIVPRPAGLRLPPSCAALPFTLKIDEDRLYRTFREGSVWFGVGLLGGAFCRSPVPARPPRRAAESLPFWPPAAPPPMLRG